MQLPNFIIEKACRLVGLERVEVHRAYGEPVLYRWALDRHEVAENSPFLLPFLAARLINAVGADNYCFNDFEHQLRADGRVRDFDSGKQVLSALVALGQLSEADAWKCVHGEFQEARRDHT